MLFLKIIDMLLEKIFGLVDFLVLLSTCIFQISQFLFENLQGFHLFLKLTYLTIDIFKKNLKY